MARKLRVEYPGAVYHVLNRGNRKEAIYRDDTDRQRFLDILAEACAKTGWQIHALCLMPNHFHLVVETPQPNLVTGMKWFLGAYTGGLNRRHRRCGHLFSRRYKSLVVDGSEMPVPTRGWCLGTERFREELLEPMETQGQFYEPSSQPFTGALAYRGNQSMPVSPLLPSVAPNVLCTRGGRRGESCDSAPGGLDHSSWAPLATA